MCLHLHRAFPYFFLRVAHLSLDQVETFCQVFRLSVNQAMDLALGERGQQYIYDILAVRGKPYYGYHVTEELMLKVFLFNPGHMTRLGDILRSGAVMETKFELLEAHLPFKLQVCIDYNLYGMDLIHISSFRFRDQMPTQTGCFWSGKRLELHTKAQIQGVRVPRVWLESNTPRSLLGGLKKLSACSVEVDASVEAICNARRMLREPPLTASDVPLVPSLAVLWEEERARCGGLTPQVARQEYNAETDEEQLRDADFNLRKKLETFLNVASSWNKVSQIADSGRVPTQIEHLPKANSIDYSSRKENVNMALHVQPQLDTRLLSQDREDVDALMMLAEDFEVYEEDDDKVRDAQDIMASQAAFEQHSLEQLSGEPKENEDDDENNAGMDPDIEDLMRADTFGDDADSFVGGRSKKRMGRGEFDDEIFHMVAESPPGTPSSSQRSSEARANAFFISPEHRGSSSVSRLDSRAHYRTYRFEARPPTVQDLMLVPSGKQDFPFPYFSKLQDVPAQRQKRHVFDQVYCASFQTVPKVYPSHGDVLQGLVARARSEEGASLSGHVFTCAIRPPTVAELERDVDVSKTTPPVSVSMVEGPTIGYGSPKWKVEVNQERSQQEEDLCEHLLIMAVEVFASSVGAFYSNPERDAVEMIAYAMHDQTLAMRLGASYKPMTGILFLGDAPESRCPGDSSMDHFGTEKELLEAFCNLVTMYDPDVIVGFEIQKLSFGYLIERAEKVGLADFGGRLGRVYSRLPGKVAPDAALDVGDEDDEAGGTDGSPSKARSWLKKKTSGIRIVGRIVMNLWQVLRGEIALSHYSYEACVFNLLHHQVPHLSSQVLTQWYQSPFHRWRVMVHFVNMCKNVLGMLSSLKVIERTSQLAKVFGIDFFSVLTRGSQYRVESMMLRLTKINNYALLSPSRRQVNEQHAPMCIPLIMEPLSNFYNDPVLVLDFQSLYPSMIIAYNLCFSTCLGHVPGPTDQVKQGALHQRLGCTSFKLPLDVLNSIGSENINIAPSDRSDGVMFVKPNVRAGVLPAMLKEILETRKMVKDRMKKSANDPLLKQMMDFCQLALKLIANVTYGYTSASFSGRMPCIDVADSIVGLGRRTLENAMAVVEKEWSNCKVVYGDTDSMFVLCRGSTREEAFSIGEQISQRVTSMNPRPVKLNFEKVYHPCVLQSKKRYVGWKFENARAVEGTFDAKGIETVRRDTCGAVQKILMKSLRMLFTDPDLSRIKAYQQKQFRKILTQRISLEDFIFSKEVKLGSYAAGRLPPPAALVAEKKMRRDQRKEPLYKERVRYVVVYGKPKSQLYDLVVEPEELLDRRKGLRLNGIYYITKQILPSLDRVFILIGVNVRSWFDEIPRNVRVRSLMSATINPFHRPAEGHARRHRIDQYYGSSFCPICDEMSKGPSKTDPLGLCQSCSSNQQRRVSLIVRRKIQLEQQFFTQTSICAACAPSAVVGMNPCCTSLDCPVFFVRDKVLEQLNDVCELEHFM